MDILDFILIGIGLSMDAAAVTMTNSMVYSDLPRKKLAAMPLYFGAFQGIAPLLGYHTGCLFAEIMNRYSGIITLIILGLIGAKMIKEGIFPSDDAELYSSEMNNKTLLLQAIATSIDAFAVGVSFCALSVNIYAASGIIALSTFVLTAVSAVLGRKLGGILENKAQIAGGMILIFIALKAVL